MHSRIRVESQIRTAKFGNLEGYQVIRIPAGRILDYQSIRSRMDV